MVASRTVAVIVPPVVCHNLDPHTGIPFMPHMAAHLAGALSAAGRQVQVIDCFGLQPNHRQVVANFMLMGVDEEWVVAHLQSDVRVCHIYCRTIAEFIAVERLIAKIKQKRPEIHIVLFENIQAVTSYSLKHVASEFVRKGASGIIMGEPEDRVVAVTNMLEEGVADFGDIPGVAFARGADVVVNPDAKLPKHLDRLPMPAWEKFPLQGYWTAGFAHAPVTAHRFLPILTSRGCPYRCTFCIAPEVNPTWRSRSAKHVVDEMEHFYRVLGVRDFHVSDLDPTVNDKRTREICRELIARKLPIVWKLAQGTKIETIKDEETLDLMYAAGCRFVSFSPESGSKRLLKIMNKPFDHEHGLRMARRMNELGIRMQAVFIGGVPGEEPADRDLSVAYARELIRAGVDEVSLVIFTPLPGAKLSGAINDFRHYSECTPSPSWRKDYGVLTAYRRRMYINLLVSKARFHPKKLMEETFTLLSLKFRTKMSMSLFKQAKLYGLRYAPWIFPKLDSERVLADVSK
ncbi:B12-binding domain-containing radical SAM protein [Tardiphaga sp. 866_E4_N2_1]|uniref:B12-binding domain-containing radical SAM protein n=1 Tax=unclassified Tardiphaga TaxID=2631404 RepID=UPI003F20381C